MLIGVDGGPTVPFGNLIKKNESAEWERLEDYDLPNNWLIECLVE